jgi:hypothetical protein
MNPNKERKSMWTPVVGSCVAMPSQHRISRYIQDNRVKTNLMGINERTSTSGVVNSKINPRTASTVT